MNVSDSILDLLSYGENRGLCYALDRIYNANALCAILKVADYAPQREALERPLEEILCELCDYAFENGLIDGNTAAYRDLFDTSLMGVLTPKPHEFISRFNVLYAQDPKKATDMFYKLCLDCDYIRSYRVKKDLKWKYPSKYGELDITINLSKPEKDPRAIAAAKAAPQSGYPKCLLCHENEGFAGNLSKPARQNLRQLPLTLDGRTWYMQYSPYVYYNEHCIVLSGEHTPMKIDAGTFRRALDFVEIFPHYFVGSNADLPIVGGSILSHDHMQGGCYCFPMERAEITESFALQAFPDIEAGIVNWPMSVIRLRSKDKDALVACADMIQLKWRAYSDPAAFVFAETDGEPHNTVTPIARMRDGKFELDLVLRNNITTDEHPLGVFHPHAKLHHIKKENIGLIEVMGLAVLPARLKNELEELKKAILEGRDISSDPELAKHAGWTAEILARREINASNADAVLREEVGRVFELVLEDAGVYKGTEEGRAAFRRFIAVL